MTSKKELFSTAEVAIMLGIRRENVFKKIKAGKIKAQKVGRNYVIPREEVLKLLGQSLGEDTKIEIDRTVQKALEQYGEVFRRLGKE